ncbi:MAG: phospholipid/cholesterol/gamma-HCH transport system substrate-binding protein [Thermoleophilaceae bacterium]|jgi:phospholipid/cholesterol/gamma-HCH transport system substrate-binding protein|nr:phospholipid/cholesterol/gamma-HCH transport system substrate-binding protein [Thermoleophilaceae bacterium]
MRSVSVAGRVAAVGAVVAAIVVVAILLFAGGGGYTLNARFQNAGQLVGGNLVQIGGAPAGTVTGIKITPDGQAEVQMSIDDGYNPLPRGTQAVIRQSSLSGVANRYVDLQLPPGNHTTGKEASLPNGGLIPITSTTTSVDLDQLFNTLDPPTRSAIKDFFANSAAQFKGKTAQQRELYRYLNPLLSTSSRLFGELNRDSPLLSRFLTDSSTLVSALAEKRNELAALITNANSTFRALGSQRLALEEAIARLPDFMRQANTTFVNLRAALTDVDPLVNASKPVAIKLRPFLDQLRPLARDIRPTVRDLAQVVLQPGPNNDLLDLEQSFPALASSALDTKKRKPNFGGGPVSVGTVRGAFPITTKALIDTAPIVAFGRPYTVDLFGWFDDFSTSGPTDAEGGFSRAQVVFNLFDFTASTPTLIPLGQRGENFTMTARTGMFRKCPGSAEQAAVDGSNVWSAAEQQKLDCAEKYRETGPIR